MELTKKQKKLLLYIIDYKYQHQETPTLRQCAADIVLHMLPLLN